MATNLCALRNKQRHDGRMIPQEGNELYDNDDDYGNFDDVDGDLVMMIWCGTEMPLNQKNNSTKSQIW